MVNTLYELGGPGDNAYELFMGHSLYSGKAALAKCFYNWYDIPHVNFSKPWFPQLAIEGLTINGRMYLAVSDMCLSLVSNVYSMYFNKTIAGDYGIPDMYAVVDEGRWTIDTLRELSKDVYEDLNGNNKKDDGDKFGFTSEISTTSATWVYACDQKTVEFGEDGTVTSVFNCERTQNIVEKLKALFYDTQGVIAKDISFAKADEIFMQGRALFVSSSLGNATGVFRELLFDYGILPYPKFDEAQKLYRTIAGGSVSCIAVPVTVYDTEMAGAVTTALCRESWVSVLPVYYDTVLKVKGTRDETAVRMIDILLDGRVLDATFIYDSWEGYNYKLGTLIQSDVGLASFCTANDKKVITHYEGLLKLFYDISEMTGYRNRKLNNVDYH